MDKKLSGSPRSIQLDEAERTIILEATRMAHKKIIASLNERGDQQTLELFIEFSFLASHQHTLYNGV